MSNDKFFLKPGTCRGVESDLSTKNYSLGEIISNHRIFLPSETPWNIYYDF